MGFLCCFQHYASRNGHLKACKVLLENGADPNISTTSGSSTSLHRSAMKGHTDIVNLLLSYKADPGRCDADGKTPLHKVGKISQDRSLGWPRIFLFTRQIVYLMIDLSKGRSYDRPFTRQLGRLRMDFLTRYVEYLRIDLFTRQLGYLRIYHLNKVGRISQDRLLHKVCRISQDRPLHKVLRISQD